MIQLRRIGKYEVTLMKNCFGIYLCRFWIGDEYVEVESYNKFTAFRLTKESADKKL